MNTSSKSSRSLWLDISAAASRFLHWWGGELSTLIPARARLWWREADRVVLLSLSDRLAVFERLAGERRELIESVAVEGDLTQQRAPIGPRLQQSVGPSFRLMLCLPPERVLQKALTLPLAVEENLRQTLTFELDRYTPFKSDRAYFDFRISGRDSAQKQLFVQLAVAPQSGVDQAVARAAAFGLAVDGVTLLDDVVANGSDCLNLLPPSARSRRKPATRGWWRLGLTALTLVMLIAVLAFPVWQKREAAAAMLTPLAQAKAAAQETEARRERLTKLVGDYNLLPNMKRDGHSVLKVLDELSKRLPDDTYVVQFDFDGRTVQIQGESGTAAGLVEILEASQILKDVGFKAQLTKIAGAAADRFHISATLEKPSDAPPPPEVPGAVPQDKDAPPPTQPAAPTSAQPAAPTPAQAPAVPAVQATPVGGPTTRPALPAAGPPASAPPPVGKPSADVMPKK